MSKRKKDWLGFVKNIRELSSNKATIEKMQEILKEVEEDEVDYFIFVGSADDFIVQGMHYPDSAFDGLEDEEIPMIIERAEDRVFIAAWPSSVLFGLAEKLKEVFPEKDDLEPHWQKTLEAMMNDSVELIRENWSKK